MSEPNPPANHGEIEALEQREAAAMLRGDVAVLESLWSDDLIVNSSVNLIAGKQLLLEWIRSGRLRLRTFERRTIKLAGAGDLVVTTGSETSQLVSERIPDELSCSYMNTWARHNGAWKLVGRHVGLIARKKAEPKRRDDRDHGNGEGDRNPPARPDRRA
jgi:hypothetical protein